MLDLTRALPLACLWMLHSSASAQQPLYTLDGASSSTQFGASLAALDDLDGDGHRDFAISEPFVQITSGPNTSHYGRIQARSGATGALLWTFENDRPSAGGLGSRMETMADVTGDGVRDLLAGSAVHTPSTGPSLIGRVTLLSGADGSLVREWTGSLGGELLGLGLTSHPDLDGDGLDDVMMGSPGWRAGTTARGRVAVHSSATGSLLREILQPWSEGELGARVFRLGDLDGDGVDDIVMNQRRLNGAASRALVVSGATGVQLRSFEGATADEEYAWSAMPLPDVDGDGVDDFALGAISPPGLPGPEHVDIRSGASGALLQRFDSPDSESVTFGFSLALAGDLDLDGLEDLAVGAPRVEIGGAPLGRTRVFSMASGRELLVIDGDPQSAYGGWSLLPMGDIDGDQVVDLAVASLGSTTSGMNQAGRLNVYAGTIAPVRWFCDATPHSGGVAGRIDWMGSSSLAANDLTLVATDLPPHRFGIFAVGTAERAPVRPPGSDGNLCLGGTLGRFRGPGQILSSGAAGSFELDVDLTDLPLPGAGSVATPGTVLHFQGWFRDVTTGATSNLTDGIAVRIAP